MTEQKTNIEKPQETKAQVKKRVPVYKQRDFDYDALGLDKKKFHYRWANENESNMRSLLAAGYEQVILEGKPVKRYGKSDSIGQYLLRLPLELYLQDQEGKLQEPREVEEAMRGGSPKGRIRGLTPEYTYGGVQTSEQVGRRMINKDTGEITKISN